MYKYYSLGYRLKLDSDDFSTYEPFFNGLKVCDYINSPNAEQLFSDQLALFHEISHYYQDLFLSGCICERDFRLRILRDYANNKEDNQYESSFVNETYRYLFSKDSSFHPRELGIPLSSDDTFDSWSISYLDLLESYADIRSMKTMLDLNFHKDENTDAFIKDYILKNHLFPYEITDDRKYFRVRLRGYSRHYAICRHVFLTFFDVIQSDYFWNRESHTFTKIKVDLAHAYSFVKGEQFYPLERLVDIHLLFCIEFALTLPSATETLKQIKKGVDRRVFHPGFRFYSLLFLIAKYPETFTRLDINSNYIEVFDMISTKLGFYKFDEVIHSITDSYNNEQPYFRVISYQHVNALKETKTRNIRISNRCNTDIFEFFKKLGIAIVLWGIEKQNVYIGNGVDAYEIYCFNKSEFDFLFDYTHSEMERLSVTFGFAHDMVSLKSLVSNLLLQESAVAVLLKRVTQALIDNKHDTRCYLDCPYKDNNCSILRFNNKEHINNRCVLTPIVDSMVYSNYSFQGFINGFFD